MILPLYTSIRPQRTPYANYVIIAVNIAIFLLSYYPHQMLDTIGRPIFTPNGDPVMEPLRAWAQIFVLVSAKPALWQFVSYAFLHGGWAHLIGNMYFLHIFGNNVNDRLGNIGYTCFYLAGAVFSGLVHAKFSDSNVLGASGAVAAVTAGYMVLFPKTLITIIYWFWIIGTMEIPALFFIALKMIVIDNVIPDAITATGESNIAYKAHLGGYAYGALTAMMLLAFKFLESDHSDMWSMLRQWNRRRRYRDTVAGGYDPFSGNSVKRAVKSKEVKKTDEEKQLDEKIMYVRSEISAYIAQRNLADAAAKYIELLDIDPKHVLPRQHQLDIANQLMSESKWDLSAQAYESFLAHYRKCEYTEQVQLMLGIIYSRYISKPERAIECFKAAKDRLTDPNQLKMCNDELKKLEAEDRQ